MGPAKYIARRSDSRTHNSRFPPHPKRLPPGPVHCSSRNHVVIDPDTHTIVEANPTAVKMIGCSVDQIVGSVCHKFICPNEKGQCPITDLEKKIEQAERSLLTSNGELLPILKSVTAIPFRGRTHLLESFIDISVLKKVEDKLKNRSSELQSIVNVMSGREIRMAELKGTIKKLREQMESAGLTPIADDPLKEMGSVKREE